MPGGDTSSSKRPHRNLKDSSQFSTGVKALSGSETFANPDNLQLFAKGAGGGDYIDTEFGLSNFNPAPNYPEDTQGNAGFDSPNVGKPAMPHITPPKKGDATPGGGW